MFLTWLNIFLIIRLNVATEVTSLKGILLIELVTSVGHSGGCEFFGVSLHLDQWRLRQMHMCVHFRALSKFEALSSFSAFFCVGSELYLINIV